MANTHECILCHKNKAGRFTRPTPSGKVATDGKWKRGSRQDIPCWYCFSCLPKGQGKGEEPEETPEPQTGVLVKLEQYEGDKSKGLALLDPLTSEVEALTVETEEEYLAADDLLGRIRRGRKGWGSIWSRIHTMSVEPIRKGLDALYELNRSIDTPFGTLEASVKAKMKAYKVAEANRLAAEQQAQERERARLQAEIDEKQRKIEQAATPQMRGRLTQQVAALETKLETPVEAPQAVQGFSSSTRQKKVATATDMDLLLAAIVEGTIPADVVVVDTKKLQAYYEFDPEAVTLWPGVSVTLDVTIVGR